jgi:DNA adenine methylase
VFFDLRNGGCLTDREAILIDSNPDLIGCYECVRDDPEAVARSLGRLAMRHARHGREHYYDVRDRQFNPLREERRQDDGRIRYTPELAAMLIYLNRTGFNGLFRVNARGAFNVPAGRYAKPRIVDRTRLREVAAALSGPQVRLVWGSFELSDGFAQENDFLYIDPPYAPMTATARFTSYTSEPFGPPEQERLQKVAIRLAARGCHVLLSNSTAPPIGRLYEGNREARAAGLQAYRVPARRAVNSNASRRGPIDEYVITNVVPLEAGARESGGTGRRAGLRRLRPPS